MLPYLPPNGHPFGAYPHLDLCANYMYNPYAYNYGINEIPNPYYCYPYEQPPYIQTLPSFTEYDLNQENFETYEFKDEATTRKEKEREPKKMRPKKNVESNISNQVFSYLTSKVKSIKAVQRVLKQDSYKIDIFYEYMAQFAKNKKKYLSRKYLGDLCTFISNRKEYDDIQKLEKLNLLSLEEFRSIVGYLIFHYLRSKCTVGVLTSVKLSSELRREHLERKREILAYLEEYVQPDMKYRMN